ncbi:MAG: hypothetical protein KAX37_04640 [Opitutaceae bacterium]|nr:hypothetical protein [Opitutaceae bacterium]
MNYSILQNLVGVALLAGIVTAAVAFMDPSSSATKAPSADPSAIVQSSTAVSTTATIDSAQP